MRHRLLKYLRRALIVVAVLAVLGIAGFTWFCYWPFEGRIDDALALVPEEVEFVFRGDWDDIEASGWVQENLSENPLHPMARTELQEQLSAARLAMEDLERQINDSVPIPFDWARFGVEKDVLRGEVVFAGNICRRWGPDRGVPRHQEFLVLKRVSWRTRCIAALKHGFVREQVGPNLVIEPEGDDIYHLTFRNIDPLPLEQRKGCGDGFIVPPKNEFYLRRCNDVVAVSNSETIIRRVAQLADSGEVRSSFAARPGYDAKLRPRQVVAAVNMAPLEWYFTRLFEYYPELKPLRRFLEPTVLEKVNGSISLASLDRLEGGADISYVQGQTEDVYRSVYSLSERSVTEGLARLVPAASTFAVASLRVDPHYLLNQIVDDFLTEGDRKLWEENVRAMGEFNTVDDFFVDLSTRVGNQAMIALGRLDLFDDIAYDEWYSGDVDPKPALAIMVRIKEDADHAELREYLEKKIPMLGFKDRLTPVEYRGHTYLRGELQEKILDFALITPCFILANDYLIMCLNEDYMRQILDTVVDNTVKSIADDPTFLVTMQPLPERGHVGLFVDLEKVTRIPRTPEGAPGPGNAGWMWDRRNQWVIKEKDTRAEAIRYRREVALRYPRNPTVEQQREMIDLEDRHMADHMERYAEFKEEWRREVAAFRRLRGFGLVLGATPETISARFAIVFRQPEPWLHWVR